MFSSLERMQRRRWNRPVWISVGAHLIALTAMVFYQASPIFVTPSSLAMGNGNKSHEVLYFAPIGATNQPEPEERKSLLAQNLKSKVVHKHKQQDRREQANVADKMDASNKDASAGSEYGSLFSGDYDGHDVRPAYPIVFPDPPVARSDFPDGFQGDVIVEVAIDKFGNVIGVRLLQGIGDGVDQKVLATLQHWRYHPATMDGEPIAEKHDVHFHYPS